MIRFDPPLSRLEKVLIAGFTAAALVAGYACGLWMLGGGQ